MVSSVLLRLLKANPPTVELFRLSISPVALDTVTVAVTISPTCMAASGIDTFEITGLLASRTSLTWLIAVSKVLLTFAAASERLTLIGRSLPAATSVPPSVTVKVAV